MSNDVYGFSIEDARRIGHVVSWHEHSNIIQPSRRERRYPGIPQDHPVCGILTSNITAASPDGLTGATTFTFTRWTVSDPNTNPATLEAEATDTVGVNRSQMTGTAGKFVICERVLGEYLPVWVDC